MALCASTLTTNLSIPVLTCRPYNGYICHNDPRCHTNMSVLQDVDIVKFDGETRVNSPQVLGQESDNPVTCFPQVTLILAHVTPRQAQGQFVRSSSLTKFPTTAWHSGHRVFVSTQRAKVARTRYVSFLCSPHTHPAPWTRQ